MAFYLLKTQMHYSYIQYELRKKSYYSIKSFKRNPYLVLWSKLYTQIIITQLNYQVLKQIMYELTFGENITHSAFRYALQWQIRMNIAQKFELVGPIIQYRDGNSNGIHNQQKVFLLQNDIFFDTFKELFNSKIWTFIYPAW